MGHSSIRIKVRRRKVAPLAAKSRQFSVRNCTITVANEDAIKRQGPWKKEKHPQCKSLHKRVHGQKWIKHKDGSVELKKWDYPSEYPNPQNYQKKLWKNLGIAAKMEAYTQDKLKKWEKKHPQPCSDDDLFKVEYQTAWYKERDEALIRIRDFVVSMFDKLPLTGRFKVSEKNAVYQEKKIADIKDINGDGHRINDLNTESKLLNKAQKITNDTKAKDAKLVASNLKDHKRQKGRIILPKAA